MTLLKEAERCLYVCPGCQGTTDKASTTNHQTTTDKQHTNDDTNSQTQRQPTSQLTQTHHKHTVSTSPSPAQVQIHFLSCGTRSELRRESERETKKRERHERAVKRARRDMKDEDEKRDKDEKRERKTRRERERRERKRKKEKERKRENEVPQIQERILEVAEIIHQKRIPERIVGQIDDVQVPKILKEVVEVVKAVKTVTQERFQRGSVNRLTTTLFPSINQVTKLAAIHRPVVLQRQVPQIRTVLKTVEIPPAKFVDRVVDAPRP